MTKSTSDIIEEGVAEFDKAFPHQVYVLDDPDYTKPIGKTTLDSTGRQAFKDFLRSFAQRILEAGKKEGAGEEFVICAAVRAPDGYVVRGHRHNDAMRTLRGIPRYEGISAPHGDDQGFVTSKGRYVTRKEGCEIQKAAGIESVLAMPEDRYLNGELYSEDLY